MRRPRSPDDPLVLSQTALAALSAARLATQDMATLQEQVRSLKQQLQDLQKLSGIVGGGVLSPGLSDEMVRLRQELEQVTRALGQVVVSGSGVPLISPLSSGQPSPAKPLAPDSPRPPASRHLDFGPASGPAVSPARTVDLSAPTKKEGGEDHGSGSPLRSQQHGGIPTLDEPQAGRSPAHTPEPREEGRYQSLQTNIRSLLAGVVALFPSAGPPSPPQHVSQEASPGVLTGSPPRPSHRLLDFQGAREAVRGLVERPPISTPANGGYNAPSPSTRSSGSVAVLRKSCEEKMQPGPGGEVEREVEALRLQTSALRAEVDSHQLALQDAEEHTRFLLQHVQEKDDLVESLEGRLASVQQEAELHRQETDNVRRQLALQLKEEEHLRALLANAEAVGMQRQEEVDFWRSRARSDAAQQELEATQAALRALADEHQRLRAALAPLHDLTLEAGRLHEEARQLGQAMSAGVLGDMAGLQSLVLQPAGRSPRPTGKQHADDGTDPSGSATRALAETANSAQGIRAELGLMREVLLQVSADSTHSCTLM